ncbi:MAG: three-Cys-motif partner protein TcmP [Polaromonas sp.]
MTPTVPEIYEGREPALIKHTLLESYLETLVVTIGLGAKGEARPEICYVDCFAGPWGSDDEDLDGTSIALSLKTLVGCKEKLVSLGVNARMRALFIEKDKAAFQRLSHFLARSAPKEVECECMPGDFVDLRSDILKWCGSTSFTFFFVDPKGWTPVVIDVLKPLLQRRRSEFLINFIYDFINRTASMSGWQDEMRQLLGRSVDLTDMSPTQREDALLSAYRESLKLCAPPGRANYRPRTAYVSVLHPLHQRTKYHLVYLSSHPLGIVKFMNASEKVDIVQARVRAMKQLDERAKKSGVLDLFEDQAAAVSGEERSSPEEVDAFWRRYLARGEKRVDTAAFADILESTNWLPKELQASLTRLIKSGEVINHDAVGSRRPVKPLHFDKAGERLQLTDAMSSSAVSG